MHLFCHDIIMYLYNKSSPYYNSYPDTYHNSYPDLYHNSYYYLY